MFINSVNLELLKEITQYHPCCMLFSRVDGKILWANKKFCDWSGYTLSELERMTWMQLSVESDDLEADIVSAGNLSSASPTYVVRKQYRPKNDRPVHGNLYVTRAPLIGEMQFAFCVWEPLRNGSAEAFSLAVDHTKKATEAMAQLTKEIHEFTRRDADEDWIIATVRTARKHPKVVIALLGLLISGLFASGSNSLIELGQRIGILPLPTPPVPSEPKSQAMFSDPLPSAAGIARAKRHDMEITTPSGSHITWNRPAEKPIRYEWNQEGI